MDPVSGHQCLVPLYGGADGNKPQRYGAGAPPRMSRREK